MADAPVKDGCCVICGRNGNVGQWGEGLEGDEFICIECGWDGLKWADLHAYLEGPPPKAMGAIQDRYGFPGLTTVPTPDKEKI